MKKFFTRFVYTSLLFILGSGIFFQVKVERYMNTLSAEYGFYNERQRLCYTPFVWFYLQSKWWGIESNRIYWAAIHLPYKEKNLLDRNYMRFNIEYNAYAMYCYYDKTWLLNRPSSTYNSIIYD